MKSKKIIGFAVLFALLIGFSLVSLGIINSEGDLVKAVAAANENKKSDNYVQVLDEAFDVKVLRFLKQEKVCAITDEQAEILSEQYETEKKEIDVNGDSVKAIYVKGNPLNRNIVEKILGITFGEDCQVVHGNKIIALVTPIFVS